MSKGDNIQLSELAGKSSLTQSEETLPNSSHSGSWNGMWLVLKSIHPPGSTPFPWLFYILRISIIISNILGVVVHLLDRQGDLPIEALVITFFTTIALFWKLFYHHNVLFGMARISFIVACQACKNYAAEPFRPSSSP
jgi:hypothetical protein